MTPSRIALLLVCVLAGAVYLNSLGNGFALDDTYVVRDTENVHGIEHLWDAISSSYWNIEPARIGMYRPLTSASFAIDWELWDGDPTGFHAMNVLLHVVLTALVFLLVFRLYPSALGAGLAAGIFAVHPVHVEAVANIVGRGELLAALFFLLGCLAFLRMKPGWRSTLVISVAYFLALAAKEIAVTLPGALVLLELAGARKGPGWLSAPSVGTASTAAAEPATGSGPDVGTAGPAPSAGPISTAQAPPGIGGAARGLVARWPLFFGLIATLALYLMLRTLVLGELLGTGTAAWFWGLPEHARIFTAIRTWTEYVRLMIFPLNLSADYGPSVIVPESGMAGLVLLGLATGVVALIVVAATWRRARLVALGILWFMLTVLPVSNLAFSTGVILAERTLYLPSVGVAIGVVGILGIFRLERPEWVRGVAAVLMFAILAGGVRTWLRSPTWKDSNTVINQLIQDHPGSYRAQWAAAKQQLRNGDNNEGMARLRLALEMVPGYYSLRLEYAAQLMVRGHYHDAAHHYDVARQIIPDAPRGHVYYLSTLLRADSLDAALAAVPDILQAFPDNGSVHHQVARVMARAGRFDEAARHRRIAIQDTPGTLDWQQWGHLAAIQLLRGDTAAALAALDSAAAIAPDSTHIPTVDDLSQRLDPADRSALPLW